MSDLIRSRFEPRSCVILGVKMVKYTVVVRVRITLVGGQVSCGQLSHVTHVCDQKSASYYSFI